MLLDVVKSEIVHFMNMFGPDTEFTVAEIFSYINSLCGDVYQVKESQIRDWLDYLESRATVYGTVCKRKSLNRAFYRLH